MCGGAKIQFKGVNIDVGFGYRGGTLEVGGVRYNTDGKKGYNTIGIEGEGKDEIIKKLTQFSKDELIDIMLKLVENAEEY